MIRTALIGTGAIARVHVAAIRKIASAQIVGVCDLSAALAEAAAEEFSVQRWYTDVDRLLAELRPDVVHVTTPPASHFGLALKALDAGAHVLVEKPITFRSAELEELFVGADRSRRLVIENHNYRFLESVQRALGLVQSGELGEVVHADVSLALGLVGPGRRHGEAGLPSPSLSQPGGVVADYLTHLAYLACAFVGDPRSIRTIWSRREPAGHLRHDEFRALIDAERGTATLLFSARAQPDSFLVRVQGTRLQVTAGLFEPLFAVERVRAGPRPLQPIRNGIAMAQAHRRAAFGGLWRKLAGRPSVMEGISELVARFYRAIEDGTAPPVERDQIRATHRIFSAAIAEEPGT